MFKPKNIFLTGMLAITVLIINSSFLLATDFVKPFEPEVKQIRKSIIIRDDCDKMGVVTDQTYRGGEDIESAVLIPELPFYDVDSTTGFNDDYDEACPHSSTSPDVVYKYTPVIDEMIDISLCNPETNYDTKLYVYQNSHTPGMPFACDDDACPGYLSKISSLMVFGGNTYYIVVDGYGGDAGRYGLMVTVPIIGGCTGDDCNDPIQLSFPEDLPYLKTNQYTCNRLDDYGAGEMCSGYGYGDGEDLVYQFNVSSMTEIEITIEPKGTTWSYVEIRDECQPPNGNCIYHFENSSGSAYVSDIVTLNPGTYFMLIDTWPTPSCIPDFDITIEQVIGYICGDANDDGSANMGDAGFIINYIFYDGPAPDPIESGDANGDGSTNLADAGFVINYIFYDGPAPICR